MFPEFHGGRGATGTWLLDGDFNPAKFGRLLQLPLPNRESSGEFPDGHLLPSGPVKDALYSFETFAAEQVGAHDVNGAGKMFGFFYDPRPDAHEATAMASGKRGMEKCSTLVSKDCYSSFRLISGAGLIAVATDENKLQTSLGIIYQ